jgi:hypothetical protein
VSTTNPVGVRDGGIQVMTRTAYQRWVALGLHGIEPDGREARVWRGRNSMRDAAFANLLRQDLSP